MTSGESHDTFGLEDPQHWSLETGEEVVVVNSKSKQVVRKVSSHVPAESSGDGKPQMEYDSDLEEWVEKVSDSPTNRKRQRNQKQQETRKRPRKGRV